MVLLTFLDPVCTSDCPLIAQEFRQADQLLGGQSRQVELVAVVTNPVYTQPGYTAAFDRQEHMSTLPNWQYLTGSVAQLKKVWRQYGIAAQILPAGGMIGHSDIAYVIDRSGRTRTELNFDPGPGHVEYPGVLRGRAVHRGPADPGLLVITRPRRGARRGSAGRRHGGRAGQLRQRARGPGGASPPRPSACPWPPPPITRTAAGPCWSWAGPPPSTTTSGRCSSAPAGAAAWKLATPLGVASNGGITVAAEGGPALAAAIRPSQDLSFSPLASSSDNGAKWAQSGLLDARLAGYPDALASAPGGGLIALTRTGNVERSAHPGAAWARLASAHTVAAAAGRGCRPAQLTSVAYSPSGLPLVAGACASAGQADIVRLAGGHWSRTGPALPAALARRDVEVLQMARAGRTVAALLDVGRGPAARLLGAWSNQDGTSWSCRSRTRPARRGRSRRRSAAAGPGRLARRWLAGCPAVGRPGRVRQRARCGLAVPARAARRGVAACQTAGPPWRRLRRRIRGPDGPGQPAVGLGPVPGWFRVGPVPGHQRGHPLRLVLVR